MSYLYSLTIQIWTHLDANSLPNSSIIVCFGLLRDRSCTRQSVFIMFIFLWGSWGQGCHRIVGGIDRGQNTRSTERCGRAILTHSNCSRSSGIGSRTSTEGCYIYSILILGRSGGMADTRKQFPVYRYLHQRTCRVDTRCWFGSHVHSWE
jgi:hypothetical protein